MCLCHRPDRWRPIVINHNESEKIDFSFSVLFMFIVNKTEREEKRNTAALGPVWNY